MSTGETANGRRRIRTLIVDDEVLARRRLAAMLADEAAIDVIGEADGGSAAVQTIASERPDLIFLDVQMPGLDAFGVLRCTRGTHEPAVVFVTAYDEYAVRAFEVHAVDYLLKPVSTARLRQAVHRAAERIRSAAAEKIARPLDRILAEVPATLPDVARIPIRTNDGVRVLSVSEIGWIEARGARVRVHAGTAVHIVRETLACLEARLEPFSFVRIHRSILVNAAAVSAIHSVAKGGYCLTLRDGVRVRSGRRHRAAVRSLMP